MRDIVKDCSQTVCGYWYDTDFFSLENKERLYNDVRRQRCTIFVSYAKQKTYFIPHIYEYPIHVPHEKDDSRIYCITDIQPKVKW